MSLRHFQAIDHAKLKCNSAFYPNKLDLEFVCEGPSMTRQEFTDECDVNMIMARYEKGGVWPYPPNGVEPQFVDFVGMPDLQEALGAMDAARDAFMRLPAIVRKEFDNDAVRFVEFAQDGNNLGKMREWGLADPEKVPDEPMRVRVMPEPDAPPIVPTTAK